VAHFPVVLDTCVLYPARTRDVLLSLAADGLYEPHWTEDILDELRRNLLAKVKPVPNVDNLIDVMTNRWPNGLISNYASLVPSMTCDVKDRHVLAAAVRAHAEVIVTSNVKDFPGHSTEPYDVRVVRPDDFALDVFELNPRVAVRALSTQATRLNHTLPSLLEGLKRPQRLPKFATRVCQHIAQHGWPTSLVGLQRSAAEAATSTLH
jgi:predicted nucleic acid-binding protein